MKNRIELMEDYKKSNKERREKIAKKAGFTSGEAYYKDLCTLKSTPKVKVSKKKKEEEKVKMDYVVAFDTTGSMASYIEAVKKHVSELIPQMFSQGIDLKMKIIAFGDYCDMTSATNFGLAYQQSSLTDNENELISFINNAKGTGGGDGDEFYELVIKKITEETPWRPDAKRVVLLIADCEPHKVGYSLGNIVRNAQIDWRQEAQKAALANISFDTLSIAPSYAHFYQELSKITNGISMPFKSSSKTAQVVAASSFVRGSSMSKATFTASYDAAVTSGDTELIGTYKSLSTLL